ncbi:MAG: OFA family MFS transporter [Burkholderiales bacterium]|jgi:MFS family permease|nr:OFA family MFS transporter [Burkholderiales bacterium]
MQDHEKRKKANVVLLAGVFFNLAIGVLYAWSVLKTKMTASVANGGWEWTSSEAGLPYTFAIVCFALGLLIGGKVQDKIGPRWVVTAGGAFVGLGLILSGLVGNSPMGIAVCFGVASGLGIGLGYGCVFPPALKWFHPSKKGIVSGLIAGGFGLAAMYFAPLTTMLLNHFGIEKTLMFLGVGIFIVSTCIAQLIKNPPEGYAPAAPGNLKESAAKSSVAVDATTKEMLKTKRFYLMFVMFLLSASIGLMVIGNITKIASSQLQITDTAILAMLVSFLAFTNTFGRVLGGLMSDKIGRVNALFVVSVLQLLNMVGFIYYQNMAALAVGIVLVGFCYGTLLSVFPALTADQYGLKNYGGNYGVLFLSWGLSGVVAPLMTDYIYDTTGKFITAYIICAGMMAVVIFANYLLKKDIAAISKA